MSGERYERDLSNAATISLGFTGVRAPAPVTVDRLLRASFAVSWECVDAGKFSFGPSVGASWDFRPPTRFPTVVLGFRTTFYTGDASTR